MLEREYLGNRKGGEYETVWCVRLLSNASHKALKSRTHLGAARACCQTGTGRKRAQGASFPASP